MKSSGVSVVVDRMAAITKAIGSLVSRDVLVGVPQTKAPREGDPINNATIGYINEFGSPSANIPARPHLAPGIQAVQGPVARELGGAAQAALSGNTSAVSTRLNRAGIVAQNSVREKITDGPFVPLADSTVAARARRGRKGAAEELNRRDAGEDAGTELARPLIDTGQYRNSIVYVVR